MKPSIFATAILLSIAASAPVMACGGSIATEVDAFESAIDFKVSRCAELGAKIVGGNHVAKARTSGPGVRTVILADGVGTRTVVDNAGRDLHTGVVVQDGGQATIRSRGADIGTAARAMNGARIDANTHGANITLRLEAR